MKRKNTAMLEEWFLKEIERLLPAGTGSLSLRKSPCIRERCHVCETGEGHPSYVLYVRFKGRKRAIYVPDDLVEEVEGMIRNGRRVQELLKEFAIKYTEALRDERKRRKEGEGI